MHDCSHSLLTLSFCKLKAMPKNCTKFDKHLGAIILYVCTYKDVEQLYSDAIIQRFLPTTQNIKAHSLAYLIQRSVHGHSLKISF